MFGQAVLPAEVGGDGPVDIVAPQAVVAGDGGDLNDVLKAVHHADVQRPPAKVHDHQLTVPGLRPLPVAEGGGGGLVNQPLHRQSGQLSGQLGGAALVVVEVGGHADDRFLHRFSQIPPGVLQQLAQDQGGQLLRLEGPASQGKGLFGAHPHLKGGSGGLRVGNQPLLGRSSYQHASILQQAHRAAGLVFPQLIGDQLGPALPIDAGQTVRGSKVNSNNRHMIRSFRRRARPLNFLFNQSDFRCFLPLCLL